MKRSPINPGVFLLLLALLLPGVGSGAPPASNEPLSSLVEEALANNPSMDAAQMAIQEAEAALSQARSSFWPVAQATGAYTRPSYVPEAQIGPGRTLKFGTENQVNAELRATYPFFTWGRNEANVKLSELNRETSRDAWEQASRALTLAVTRIYFGIALSRSALDWANENADLLRSQVDLVKKQYDNGFASDFDVLRMEVELAGAESEIVSRKSQLVKMEVSLNRLLGRPLDADVSLMPDLPESPPGNVDTVDVERAADDHLKLKMLRRGYARFEAQRTMTRSQWLRPMPAAFFSYLVRNGQFPDVQKFQDSWSIGLSVSVPLFDGFLAKRKLEQIDASERKLKAEELDTRREIGEQILQARSDLREALEQIEIGGKRLQQANESYDIARRAYETGALSSMDLLESQRTLRRAHLTLLGYQYDATVKWCTMRDAEYLPYVEAFEQRGSE